MNMPRGSTEPARHDSAEAARRSRVLIIHGDAATRDVLLRGLAYDMHEIIEAASGRAALDRVATEPFDLVLLDLAPTDVDGFQLLTQLTADSRFCHIPVIMLAPPDQSDGIARCFEAGAQDFLPPPYHPFLVRARVSASLEKKRLRESEKALHEAMAASHLAHEKLLQETLAGSKSEIVQLQETIKALRRQLDAMTSETKAAIDAARSSAAAELRQLRATCRVLREQLDAAISGRGLSGASRPLSGRPPGQTSDGR
jgi:DNA-binding response OmpR family regulator